MVRDRHTGSSPCPGTCACAQRLPNQNCWHGLCSDVSHALCNQTGSDAVAVEETVEHGTNESVVGELHAFNPAAHLLASSNGRNTFSVAYSGSTSPQWTAMRCIGTTTTTRACHFQNIYYELSSERFVYFGPTDAAWEHYGHQPDPDSPWMRLVRCVSQHHSLVYHVFNCCTKELLFVPFRH